MFFFEYRFLLEIHERRVPDIGPDVDRSVFFQMITESRRDMRFGTLDDMENIQAGARFKIDVAFERGLLRAQRLISEKDTRARGQACPDLDLSGGFDRERLKLFDQLAVGDA